MSGHLQKHRILLVVAVVLALILAVVIYLGRQPGAMVASTLKALPDNIDLALDTIDYTHLTDGVRRWRLRAERVERSAAAKGLDIRAPQLTLFDAHGEQLGEATALSGWVSSDYRQVRLLDDVEVVHVDGYTLYTTRLDFDQASRSVATDAPIRLVGEKLELHGTGLQLDLENEKLRVPADVRTVFSP